MEKRTGLVINNCLLQRKKQVPRAISFAPSIHPKKVTLFQLGRCGNQGSGHFMEAEGRKYSVVLP